MFQAGLICALCNRHTHETGYRMMINLAVCNKCVDQLILDALQKISMVVPAKGVQ